MLSPYPGNMVLCIDLCEMGHNIAVFIHNMTSILSPTNELLGDFLYIFYCEYC